MLSAIQGVVDLPSLPSGASVKDESVWVGAGAVGLVTPALSLVMVCGYGVQRSHQRNA